MKKLNTNNAGRMPLWQKDLDFIQEAFTEPLMALIAELKHDNAVAMAITGCKVTETDTMISMTSGWFWWDGELLPVRELTPTNISSFTNPVVHLEKITYNNPDGARNFIHADLTSESVSDIWQDDYIQPSVVERGDTFNTGVHLLYGAQTLTDWIRYRTRDNVGSWLPTRSEINNDNVQYKRVGRMVVLKGTIYVRDGSGMPKIEGLPVPIAGKAYLTYNKITNGAVVSVDEQGCLDCISLVDDMTSYPVDGMMYMAQDPYLVDDTFYVDTDVVVCGPL